MPVQGQGQPRSRGRMRKLTLAALTAVMGGYAAEIAQATEAPLSGEAAREALAATGTLDSVQIEGALDWPLTTPDGSPLILNEVNLRGALRNAPAAPLEIRRSKLGGVHAPHVEWRSPVDIERTDFTGHVNFDGARFEKEFACRRCRVSSLSARRARFDDDADFSFSEFEGVVDFGAARFHAAAFDGARFSEGGGAPNFSETDFAGEARFTRVSTGEAPANFLGASFRGEANFRSCDFGRGIFSRSDAPDKRAGPMDTEIASFGQLADFRSCEFRHGADFSAAAFQAEARFDGATVPAGVLDLRGLTRAEGDIVLRDMRMGPQATVALDEESIARLRSNSTGFDPSRWRSLSPDYLDAIADRAKLLGFERSARRLQYEASTQRAFGADATFADRAEWALQWPSANGTDLARPLVLGGFLWLCAILLTLKRGVLVEVVAPEGEKANLFVRVAEPIYLPPEETALQTGRLPKGAYERAKAAVAFGFTLVFKFGARRFRPAHAARWRASGLFIIWLAGFAAVAAVTVGQMLPGLREMISALP